MRLKSQTLLFLLAAAARGAEQWTHQCPDGERNVAVTVTVKEGHGEKVEFNITDACADDGVVLASKAKADHPSDGRRYHNAVHRHEFCLPATRRWRLSYHDDEGDKYTGSEVVFAEKEYGDQVEGGAPLCAPDAQLRASGGCYSWDRVQDRTFEVGRVCEDTGAPTTTPTASPTESIQPSSLPSVSPTIAPTKRPTPHPTYPPHRKTPEEISFYLFQFKFTYQTEEVCAPVAQPKRMPGGWPSECALSCAHLTSCPGFVVFDPPVVDGEGCELAKVGTNYECEEGEMPNAFFYSRDVSMHFGDLVQD